MKWQKKARFALAIFGIALVVVLYAAVRERQEAAPVDRPVRLDPQAIVESIGGTFEQLRAARQDYFIEYERQLTYEGGAAKFVGLKISSRGRAGRDFVVSGREAQATGDQQVLDIAGEVSMSVSDGLMVTADRATFNRLDGTLSIPGQVSFQKGGISGSGVGMTYNQESDLLVLQQQTHVTETDPQGKVVTEFSSASATLSRPDNFLSLAGNVQVMRDGQLIVADRGIARLSENEEYVTFIELRGNTSITGGATFETLSARDVDLDYTDDGTLLERVALSGGGAIGFKGEGGAMGRQLAGESLDVGFAPDGTVVRIVGDTGVRIDFPAAADSPARTISSRTLDANGEPGRGLTRATFTDTVEYREAAQRAAGARVVHAGVLVASLSGDAVTTARFSGGTRFEEAGLQASAADAEYDPARGTLRLTGSHAGAPPRVADEQITIEAANIDVTLQGRTMIARDSVRTTVQPQQQGTNRLPRMLEQGRPVTINAEALSYEGASGRAIYRGNADLLQGSTSIRAQVLTLDRATGDLIATGSARSSMTLDAGTSQGSAAEIRYDDGRRLITYDTPASRPPAPPAWSRLSGAQGDLTAARIEVILAPQGSEVERLEATTGVSIRLETRRATSTRMIYYASDNRYELTGLPTAPVNVVENCRETTGRTVTLFRDSDRIIVDGNEETRTQSRQGAGPCLPALAR
jgi:lipopolysaccharide export system protein LptA